MKEPESRSRPGRSRRTVVVDDRAAASALLDPSTVRHLAPFLGAELSVTEAARLTGEKPNTVLKRVRRFVELGLLEVARERERAGRPIKLYSAVADVFFVPFAVTEAESYEAVLRARESYAEELLRRNVVRTRLEAFGEWGTRIYRDERGRLQVQTAVTPDANVTMLDPGAPAVLSAWRDAVMLDFEDAKALQREMFDLLLRYLEKEGSQRYVVHLAMAPVLG
ncbi:MAG TPA: hypothetical protein VF202_08380 [Trueperaceae bacterium]